jgi:hypothetical protein
MYRFIPTAALLLLLTAGPRAAADIVRLKTGGELRGSIRFADDQQINFVTLAGTTLSLPADVVHFSLRRSDLEEEYETRLAKLPNTVEAHLDLADWCKANRLRAQRQQQLRHVLTIDPNHEGVRKLLEYTRDGVLWKTRDQILRERGLVRTRRKYITRQERDSIAETTAQKEQETAWSRQMARIAEGIRAGDPNAVEAIRQVRDPMAIAGLTAFFREASEPAVRDAYVFAIGQIEHPKALPPLIEQAVLDTVPQIRTNAAALITKERAEAATALLVRYLEVEDNQTVRNAADALGLLGHPKSLAPLIEALVTQHQYSTRPSAAAEVAARAADLLNRPDLNPAEIVVVMQAGLTPRRGVDATTDESNGRVQLVYPHRNANVLAALRRMTGQDFGYDQRTWRLWLRAQSRRR